MRLSYAGVIALLAPASMWASAPARTSGEQKPPLAWVRTCWMLDERTVDLLEKRLAGRPATSVRNQLGEPDRSVFAKGHEELCYKYGRGLIRVIIAEGRVRTVLIDLWPAP